MQMHTQIQKKNNAQGGDRVQISELLKLIFIVTFQKSRDLKGCKRQFCANTAPLVVALRMPRELAIMN